MIIPTGFKATLDYIKQPEEITSNGTGFLLPAMDMWPQIVILLIKTMPLSGGNSYSQHFSK